MLTYIRKMLKNDKGFTLIELMVVVVILGILAAVAIPKFTGQSDKAKENRAKADLRTITNALELYYFDNDEYPDDIVDLTTGENYLKDEPKDPWEEKYTYDPDTDNKGYELYCDGPDGNIEL